MNQRVMFVARRLVGPDVEAASTGTLRPVPFGGLILVVVLLGAVAVAGITRSLGSLVLLAVVLGGAALVVARGHQLRVLVVVRGGYVELHRWGFPYRSTTFLTRFPHRDLWARNKGRAFVLYLAPGGEITVDGSLVALNQPLE